MPIEGGLRDKLEPGTVLSAKYKGTEYRATVVEGDEGKVRYRLEDGREFRSPSAAASALMDGKAANGWRWWSVLADEPASPVKSRDSKPRAASKAKPARTRSAKAAEPVEAPAEAESAEAAEETTAE